MLVYNLFPLLAGHFGTWKPHLKRAADMGFDWIFVNPIQKPGSSGSLYSISDYFQLNPILLDKNSDSQQQVKEMIETANHLGLKVMIDLVINHCAFDSMLVSQHPEWFLIENGEVVHPFCVDNGNKIVWGDLVSFNHQSTSINQYFYEIISYLLNMGFQGLRCDAAYQVPASTWHKLINDVHSHYPETIFAAETLGCTLEQTKQTAQAGFDYIFNSSKWWDFNSNWLIEQQQILYKIAPSISFPESHDTDRLFKEVNGNAAAMKQRYLFTALFSSGVMIPIGFEYGFYKRLHVVNTRPSDWEEPNIDLCNFIARVNTIKKRYRIFHTECVVNVEPHEDANILILHKFSDTIKEEAFIIINKDIINSRNFFIDKLSTYTRISEDCLVNISPEIQLEHDVPRQLSCNLEPGQAIVLINKQAYIYSNLTC